MCGIVGVIGVGYAPDVAVRALSKLQDRGSQGSGMGTIIDGVPKIKRSLGKINRLRKSFKVGSLISSSAITHTRYGTKGKGKTSNLQPFPSEILVGHNGEFLGTDILKNQLISQDVHFDGTTDSEVALKLLENTNQDLGIIDRLLKWLENFEVAFSLVILWEGHLIGVCDKKGMHPLVMGQFEGGGYIFASEEAALRVVNAKTLKFLKPGQMMVISPDLKVTQYSLNGDGPEETAHCCFNLVYTGKPSGRLWDRSVSKVREALGKQVFKEQLESNTIPEVDNIIPVLNSGLFTTLAYAKAYAHHRQVRQLESGIGIHALRQMDINTLFPLEIGLNVEKDADRSFMLPDQQSREYEVLLKHLVDPSIVEGKRVLLGDDSIVRGTTSRIIIQMVRDAGAKEVHFITFTPPVTRSCPYGGAETKPGSEPLALMMDTEEIRQHIGADSLHYLSQAGFDSVINRGDNYCMYCFNSEEPVPLTTQS